MEVEVLNKEKNELKLQFSEADQGFLNLIKSALWQNSATDIAGFKIEHPQASKPVFILKTKGKEAKKVWNEALDSISEQLTKFEAEVKKIK